MTNTPGNLISRQDAADRAGVGIRTVDHWRRTGKISTYRDGLGHVRLDPEEVDDLLAVKREVVRAQ
jgi:excisionase family DNA binding protein